MEQNLDLLCLKAMKTDPEMGRVSRLCASIVVRAHALARDVPERREDAMRIVELTRDLYGTMPSRAAVDDMLNEFLEAAGIGAPKRRSLGDARAAFVDRLWRHLLDGP